MLIVNDGLGDRLDRPDDAVLDQGSGLRHSLWPILAHQVELETAQVPLATQSVIVLGRRLLNRHIRQMHVVILDLLNLVGVALMSEPAET